MAGVSPWVAAPLLFFAGVAVSAIGFAGAAQLNGIDPQTAGTGVGVTASCDENIGTSWITGSSPIYVGDGSPADSTFTVSGLDLTGVDPSCDGKQYQVVVAGPAGAELTSSTGALVVDSGEATITFSPVNARQIEQVAVVLYG
jgi:hypothetical protein